MTPKRDEILSIRGSWALYCFPATGYIVHTSSGCEFSGYRQIVLWSLYRPFFVVIFRCFCCCCYFLEFNITACVWLFICSILRKYMFAVCFVFGRIFAIVFVLLLIRMSLINTRVCGGSAKIHCICDSITSDNSKCAMSLTRVNGRAFAIFFSLSFSLFLILGFTVHTKFLFIVLCLIWCRCAELMFLSLWHRYSVSTTERTR